MAFGGRGVALRHRLGGHLGQRDPLPPDLGDEVPHAAPGLRARLCARGLQGRRPLLPDQRRGLELRPDEARPEAPGQARDGDSRERGSARMGRHGGRLPLRRLPRGCPRAGLAVHLRRNPRAARRTPGHRHGERLRRPEGGYRTLLHAGELYLPGDDLPLRHRHGRDDALQGPGGELRSVALRHRPRCSSPTART